MMTENAVRRATWLALSAAALSACGGGRLSPGPANGGYAVVVASGSAEEARRSAVSGFLDLFLSSGALAANEQVLRAQILAKPGRFIVREKAEAPRAGQVELSAVVDYIKLGKELDALGLVRPEGVKGRPKLLVSLRESGVGAGPGPAAGPGRASEAMTRRLTERGYAARDDSESLLGGRQRTGSREEALSSGRKAVAEVVITGEAQSELAPDPRLSGYSQCRALVKADAVMVASEKTVGAIAQEATAVDVEAAAAGAKALENAGEIGADKLAAALASVYPERSEFTVSVLNLGGLDRSRQLLRAARGLEPVVGAAFDAMDANDVRFKIFTGRMGADELVAVLLKLRDFKFHVRQIDSDFKFIELASGELY